MQNEQLTLNLDINDEYMVVQSNNLIMGKYDLSAMEQKLFLILVSTITKDDKDIKNTVFRVRDLADIMGISPEYLYNNLPKMCESIMSKVIKVQKDDGKWHMFNLMPNACYHPKQGIIELELNKKAKPYLIELKKLFTTFKLKNAINLSGKYAIRLYQLTKSSLYKGEIIIELADIKDRLMLTQKSYEKFCNINTKVIQPSIREINEKTDINVECELIKSGREVIALKFNIKNKTNKQKVVYVKNTNSKQHSKFNNFEGRDYTDKDYEVLKNKLLGWDDEVAATSEEE